MDAFFASVEQLDDPNLRGRPVLVGGRSARGVVAAASYEARPTGVRSAMPMMEALRRCPDAVVVPPRRSRYVEVSRRVFETFRRYTPLVEGLSLDEAFLDVTGSRSLFGEGAAIAEAIRADIRSELGLTASAGVAPSKFVAKIASDFGKPDGLTVVAEHEVSSFLAPLPLKRMWRVGPKARVRLEAAGFQTVGDLAAADEETLRLLLGSWSPVAKQLAQGIDDRPVVCEVAPKSLGSEETFEHDLRSREALEAPILAQCLRVADRLVHKGLWARTMTVKIKYSDHTIRTRQGAFSEPVADPDALFTEAKHLLTKFSEVARGVRLTGVSVSGLEAEPEASLFPDAERERRHKLEAVAADLRARFGARGMTRARLLDLDSSADAHASRHRRET